MSRMMNDDVVVMDIKGILGRAKAPVTKECCIYRVPYHIREAKEEAYTPKIVSIGPFHHNDHPRLRNMERHKLSYCKAFLERTETSLDSWISYIEEVEPYFRGCYSDTIEFSKEELTKIIIVDSGFILEYFFRCYFRLSLPETDLFLLKPSLSTTIRKDLLLLENQLPFIVLEHLFNLSPRPNNFPSFLELTFAYFGYYNSSKLNSHDISILHFTDLLRTFHLQHPPEQRPPRNLQSVIRHVPSATQLSEAGMKLKETTGSTCLLDLTFSRQIFEIPRLEVNDDTELLFRNMVALEQCHYPLESYIKDLFHVLDFLVNTGKDVDILVQNGVMVNWLGDADSVANLFNGLLKNVTISSFNSHYIHLCKKLNDFYRNPWHNLKSTLRRDYCKSPWQTAATIAAIVLLVLSVVQTVCSILQVTQQQKASPAQ